MARVAAWVSLWSLFSMPFLAVAQTLPSIESPTTTARRYLENLIQSLIIQQDPLAPIPVQSTQAVDTLEMLLQQPTSVLPATGAVSTTTQALIDSLLAQVAVLQAQIDAILAQRAAAGEGLPAVFASCPNIVRTLQYGSEGPDVTQLQEYLVAEGLLPEGLATGFFDELTQAAVQAWQVVHNIVLSGSPETTGYGLVGPQTRAALQAACTAS